MSESDPIFSRSWDDAHPVGLYLHQEPSAFLSWQLQKSPRRPCMSFIGTI